MLDRPPRLAVHPVGQQPPRAEGVGRGERAGVVLVDAAFAPPVDAGGGADVTVLALMLLALVLARDRRPLAAGLAIGAAVAIKQLARPLLPFLIVVARDGSGRPARGRMRRRRRPLPSPWSCRSRRGIWARSSRTSFVSHSAWGSAHPGRGGDAGVVALVRAGPPEGVGRGCLGLVVGAAGVAMRLRRPIRTAAGAAERAGRLMLLAWSWSRRPAGIPGVPAQPAGVEPAPARGTGRAILRTVKVPPGARRSPRSAPARSGYAATTCWS